MKRIFLYGMSAIAALIAVILPASAQTLAADYQLQNTYDSSVGTIGPFAGEFCHGHGLRPEPAGAADRGEQHGDRGRRANADESVH